MCRKLCAVLTAAVMCVLMCVPAFAAPTTYFTPQNTRAIAELKAVLEQKYSIRIQYPKTDDGEAGLLVESLESLDMALMNATPTIVRQISSYYRKQTGNPLAFSFVYRDMDVKLATRGLMMAAFEPSSASIEIYVPVNNRLAFSSGENPVTILHELGHAVHMMMDGTPEGQLKMEAEWVKLNGQLAYSGYKVAENVSPRIFVTAYASSTFAEDFAETFGMALCSGRAGMGLKDQLYKDGQQTRLATKLNYIIRKFPEHFTDSDEIVANLKKAFTASTVFRYEGIDFSGEYLKYRGYPQPKNIYSGLVSALELSVENASWMRDLGAWRVVDASGRELFLFPGGVWCDIAEMRQAA